MLERFWAAWLDPYAKKTLVVSGSNPIRLDQGILPLEEGCCEWDIGEATTTFFSYLSFGAMRIELGVEPSTDEEHIVWVARCEHFD